MKIWYCLTFLFFFVVNARSVEGQNIVFQLTMLSNPVVTVNSVDAYTNGVTISNTTLRTYVKKNTPWRLSIAASGTNLVNGTSTIPISQIKMQVTNTTITDRPLITLSSANQTLAADASVVVSDRTTDLNINYILAGGANLLNSAGSYQTTLTFTLAAY